MSHMRVDLKTMELDGLEIATSSPTMQGLHQLNKRQVGSLSELKYFFEELSSWRDERKESQRRLDNLLSSYSGSIRKGINSLIEEVGDLQAKNSLITKDNKDLLAIVKKMSVEVEQQGAHFQPDKLMPEPKENSNEEVDSQEKDTIKVDELPHGKEEEGENKGKDSLQVAIETHDEGFEDDVAKTMREEETDQVNPHPDEGTNKLTDEDSRTVEHVEVEEQETYVRFDTTAHEEKEILTEKSKHLKSKHRNTKTLKFHKEPNSAKRKMPKFKGNFLRKSETGAVLDIKRSLCDKLQNGTSIKQNLKLMCDKCPYETLSKGTLLQHGKMHKGLGKKKLICDQCPYVTSNKESFLQHFFKMHKDLNIKGGVGKKLMCDQCPYETSVKSRFLTHSQVHNDIRNYMCELCPYKAKLEHILKGHIKSVHEKIRDLVCDRCGYATSRPSTLSEHKQTVHNTGEKKFSCDLCPYRAHMKKILAKHIKNVHLGREYKLNCEQCNFKSNSQSNLTTHILQVHK